MTRGRKNRNININRSPLRLILSNGVTKSCAEFFNSGEGKKKREVIEWNDLAKNKSQSDLGWPLILFPAPPPLASRAAIARSFLRWLKTAIQIVRTRGTWVSAYSHRRSILSQEVVREEWEDTRIRMKEEKGSQSSRGNYSIGDCERNDVWVYKNE